MVGPGAGNGGFDEISVALVMAALQGGARSHIIKSSK